SEEEGKDKETHTPWAVVPQKKKEKEIKEKSCDQEIDLVPAITITVWRER
ncbi:MAG: hypothetical protein GY820_23700, partial [Gammaproteobacteria bacterium]|nr:hypothetical protein [Gammaproteobacteria bacterium]